MNTIKSGIFGAIAGLAGAYAMQQFRTAWNTNLDTAHGVFGLDDEADLNSVRRLFPAQSFSRKEAIRIALFLHYAYGALAGAGFGIAGRKFPWIRAGYGVLFGTGLWAVGDELAVTVTRLSDPRCKSRLSHASALFAHLLFGATAHGVLEVADRLRA